MTLLINGLEIRGEAQAQQTKEVGLHLSVLKVSAR